MIAILGASGFIGSSLGVRLQSENMEFLGVDMVKPKEGPNWLIADISDPATIERIFFEYSVDTVIHLIGLPQISLCEKDPFFSYVLNTHSVSNTLEAMRKTDVKKIIFASSAAVYGMRKGMVTERERPTPTSIYGCHKYVSEELIKGYSKSYGIHYTVLRLFNVYGQTPQLGKDVLSIFLRKAKNGEMMFVDGKNKYRDFVHIEDVLTAFLKSICADADNETINIGTGIKLTLENLVDLIKATFPGTQVKYQSSPDDGNGLVADNSLCRRILGLVPQDPFEGIRNHIKRYA